MYRIVRINNNSYPQIKQLYKLCFGVDESVILISKKYKTDGFGLKNVGFFAMTNNDEAAAYYGLFPLVLQYKSEKLIVAQSGDTMTSPAHQKKGLFLQLANETYQLAENLGIKLIFGFPNNNSLPAFKNKLDWQFDGF